ncbi:MAG: 2-C-methyl-D-erythritol 4-phosphate cytidylyltransferase, partial [Bacteroidales bacterium]|nr:2-C-methyl-D-erythritol 4-phosphate cytidylyltransferase [Bacteroidales bacterium]
GYKIAMVEGLRYNLKITTPEDLPIAKTLLNSAAEAIC